MDGGAWWAAVHGIARSQTRLSDFTFTFHFHALEKEMAPHSSVLAWRIPGTGGAWWAAVYGVAQSRTRLKRLSSSSSILWDVISLSLKSFFFIYFWLPGSWMLCSLSLVAGNGGYSLVAVHRPLIAVASLAEHRL